jgi:two-component system nitrate/nitrite response regulator NarL
MADSILIVEDHPLFRAALIHLVGATLPQAEALAVSSAEEGLRQPGVLARLRLIVLDPGLPGINGAEAIAAFRNACPQAGLVAVSASEDRRDAMAALRAGAIAFVSKAVPTEVLGALLQRVLAGAVEQPEWITPHGTNSLEDENSLALTPRQREILTLLAQGHSNKEIGLRLDLAEITVKMHVSAIFRALNVANRTQAVLVARRLGLTVA